MLHCFEAVSDFGCLQERHSEIFAYGAWQPEAVCARAYLGAFLGHLQRAGAQPAPHHDGRERLSRQLAQVCYLLPIPGIYLVGVRIVYCRAAASASTHWDFVVKVPQCFEFLPL